jgi:hypothetical protein
MGRGSVQGYGRGIKMSDERTMSQIREYDDFRWRIAVMKEIIEMNFFDPMFGIITHRGVVEELHSLVNYFGYELVISPNEPEASKK